MIPLQLFTGIVVAWFVFNASVFFTYAESLIVGDHVFVTENVNVRAAPSVSGMLLGVQYVGALGTVVAGPIFANGYEWWKIGYDNAPSGWSVKNYIQKQSTLGKKFTNGERVVTTVNLNVRSSPSVAGVLVSIQHVGAFGTVTQGPVFSGAFSWWQIQYDSGVLGWSVEPYLEKHGTTTPKFVAGDRAFTTTNLNVRSSPSIVGALLGVQLPGTFGTVRSGPVFASGITWWQIQYDSGTLGWSAEYYLGKQAVLPDTTAPSIPTNLSATALSSSEINLVWTASIDNVGVKGYKVFQNGSEIADTYSTSYLSLGLTQDTAYSYEVLAYDVAGNKSDYSLSANATTLLKNESDTTPPSVEVISPGNGNTVFGTITVTANASDNTSVNSVQFQIDGINLGAEDEVSPYSTPWNTAIVSNGTHTLVALARDTSGNATFSSDVVVTVKNNTFTMQNLSVTPSSDSGNLSPYLLGAHFIYSNEADSIYSNDVFAKWAKSAGISTARFPGGTTVKYWDWQNPTGKMTVDSWDPTFDGSRADPSQWMSLDEYLHFAAVSGIKPLVGVNILSGAVFNRVDDSVARAKAQVSYVVSKGYHGAFYYLGNEDMGLIGGLDATAKIFVKHAAAIKSVDPQAKLFWNDNGITPARLKQFLAIAGTYADGVEFHGKWPGQATKTDAHDVTIDEWRNQYPLAEKNLGIYAQKIANLRQAATEAGRPDLLLADNEYGLSNQDTFVGFTRFQKSLVVLDVLQGLFVGQADMAAFWSNAFSGANGLMDKAELNRLNPMHFGFEMLSSAQGKKLVKIVGGSPSASGFSAVNGNTLEIFLLNKSTTDNEVSIKTNGNTPVSGGKTTLMDTADHWGQVVSDTVSIHDDTITTILPSMSFTKIVVELSGE